MMYRFCTGQYIWKHMVTYWRLQEDVSLNYILSYSWFMITIMYFIELHVIFF